MFIKITEGSGEEGIVSIDKIIGVFQKKNDRGGIDNYIRLEDRVTVFIIETPSQVLVQIKQALGGVDSVEFKKLKRKISLGLGV